MIESVNRLLVKLENGFTDLDEKENDYTKEKAILEQYEDMLNFIGGNAKKLNKYENQKFILDVVKEMNSTSHEYDAACYLLDSNDESVSLLPQYRNSRIYLDTIINYMNATKEKINEEVLDLDDKCTNMRLKKKYYNILKEDKPFVEDIDEFLNLLETEDIDLEERNQVLSYIIKSNVNNYIKRIKGEKK